MTPTNKQIIRMCAEAGHPRWAIGYIGRAASIVDVANSLAECAEIDCKMGRAPAIATEADILAVEAWAKTRADAEAETRARSAAIVDLCAEADRLDLAGDFIEHRVEPARVQEALKALSAEKSPKASLPIEDAAAAIAGWERAFALARGAA